MTGNNKRLRRLELPDTPPAPDPVRELTRGERYAKKLKNILSNLVVGLTTLVMLVVFLWATNELFGGGCRNVPNAAGKALLWLVE